MQAFTILPLAPFVLPQANYWWVSIILLGVLAVFVPFWLWYIDRTLGAFSAGSSQYTEAATAVGDTNGKLLAAAAVAPVPASTPNPVVAVASPAHAEAPAAAAVAVVAETAPAVGAEEVGVSVAPPA